MNTIDTILKIAGAKNMKEFYSLYPSEEAFMEKHGGAFKKVMRGAKIKKAQTGMDVSQYLQPAQETPLKLEPWMTGDSNWTVPKETGSWVGSQPDFSKMGGGKSLGIGSVMNIGEQVAEGIKMLKEEKKQLQKAKQMKGVTDVMLQASQLPAERMEKNYVRPEDIRMTGEEMFPIYGTGTNVIAKKGAKIKKANSGSMIPWQMMGDKVSNMMTQITGEDGGGKIGGAVGEAAGTLVGGPVGGAVGKVGGQLIGSLLDRKPEKIKKYKTMAGTNIGKMSMMQGMQNIFAQNNAYMKDGGEMSTFETGGDFKVLDGDIQPLSFNPHSPGTGETAVFEGASHKNGGIKLMTPISTKEGWNKYHESIEVEGGEPVIKDLQGDSVVFGNLVAPGYNGKKFKNIVKDIGEKENKEVKKLEQATEIINKGYDTSIEGLTFNSGIAKHIGSNMKLKWFEQEKQDLSNRQYAINSTAEEMGLVADALAKGKIQKDRSKKDTQTAKDGLNQPQYRSLLARMLGIEAEEGYDENKRSIGNWFMRHSGTPRQRETEESAPSRSPVPTIAPGNFPTLTVGSQQGYLSPDVGYANPPVQRSVNEPAITPITPADWSEEINRKYNQTSATSPSPVNKNKKRKVDIYNLTPEEQSAAIIEKRIREQFIPPPMLPKPPIVKGKKDLDTDLTISKPSIAEDKGSTTRGGKETDWNEIMRGLSSYLPYLRPSDVEGLDPRQLMGEMMALTETEEPVQAQFFQPQLTPPYKVSFQDRMNDVVAQTRAAQRMAGDNPAAQALIAGQAYDAMNKVRAEEFRVNQALESAAFEQSRKLIDEAKLRNLEIADTQAERQAMAKSSTKEIKRKALESISAKYMQNQLENRTLATYENLYNYRFDPNFRARNWNAPADFNIEGSDIYSPEVLRAMAEAKERQEKEKKNESKSGRNGAIVKAVKLI